MNESDKFLRLFGSIFFAVGVLLDVIGLGLSIFIFWFVGSIPLLLGIVFTSIGGGILLNQNKKDNQRDNIIKNGKKYTGKIYGYIEDKSVTMNNDYLVNIKVHYFDEQFIEREAIIPTGFTKGSGDYPIGATIDILALGSDYSWIPGSVRFEHIPNEEELMDDKPIGVLDMKAVQCKNCGATFSAAIGYASKCPYCGSSINVK